MSRALLAGVAALLLSAAPITGLTAQDRAAEAARLSAALQIDAVVAIMRDEGLDYGDQLRADMFPGRGGARWSRIVDGLYDVDAMSGQVTDAFARTLDDAEMAPLVAFFGSPTGSRIIRLELEARRALMDDDTEAAAKARVAEMRADGDPALEGIDAFIAANDLIEQNVAGAMNANFAFYSGLNDGLPEDARVDSDQILTDVWSQEDQIRADTEEWVDAFLTMAYAPLPAGDLDAYTDLSRTPAGQALNAALFAAFDSMYVDISRDLGAAASRFVAGEDI